MPFDIPILIIVYNRPDKTRKLLQTIDKLKQEKYTILLVEENLDRVLEVADHIYLLNSGKIVFSGNVKEFEKNLDSFNQYFGI